MKQIDEIGKDAKQAVSFLNTLTSQERDTFLKTVAKALIQNQESILKANQQDIERAKANEMKESLIDRLALSPERIEAMANSLIKIASLESPIGIITEGKTLPNGLILCKKRVPLGVIAILYESRPNVTVDAFGLCFKTGNAVILKGGSDALSSNIAIVSIMKDCLEKASIIQTAVQLVEDTSRETAQKLMRMNEYVDVLIPRGGKNLIQTVIQNSTVPVIETGTGNCHIYIDKDADIDMALAIVENAKVQRPGVCNACESLVIHEDILASCIPKLVERLSLHHVTIKGDAKARQYSDAIEEATEEDFYTEYLDLIVSIKTVSSLEEAISHINQHNTKHSEAIITENYASSQRFLNEIDAAAVYINASTRFTDGEEFGYGAEIGISTQKLHARGPMGLTELTTYKYIIYGNGQIR